MSFPKFSPKKRQLQAEETMEEEPKTKRPKLETENASLSRFLEIPILVGNLMNFLDPKNQLALFQTSSEWHRAVKIHLACQNGVSSYGHFLASGWPQEKLTTASGRLKILAKQLQWFGSNTPNVNELQDLTWFLRVEDPLPQEPLQQLATFQALTSLDLSSGTLQASHLDQLLSVIGGQLDSLVLKCRLLFDRVGSSINIPASFRFLLKLTFLQIGGDFLPLVKSLANPEVLEVLKCDLKSERNKTSLITIWREILPRCCHLEELEIRLPIPYISWKKDAPSLESLTTMKLSMKPLHYWTEGFYKNMNTKVLMSIFLKFPNLTNLQINHSNQIVSPSRLEEDMQIISYLCPHLLTIGLTDMFIPIGEPDIVIPQQLDLLGFQMEEMTGIFMFGDLCGWLWANLTPFSNLHLLEFHDCLLDWQTAKGFAQFPHLTRLMLTKTFIGGIEREEFVQLLISGLSQTCTALALGVKVGRHHKQLKDMDWEAILSARGAQFQELVIGESEISAQTLERICSSCTSLEQLVLNSIVWWSVPGLMELVQRQRPALVAARPRIRVIVDGEDLRAFSDLEMTFSIK